MLRTNAFLAWSETFAVGPDALMLYVHLLCTIHVFLLIDAQSLTEDMPVLETSEKIGVGVMHAVVICHWMQLRVSVHDASCVAPPARGHLVVSRLTLWPPVPSATGG